MMLHAGGFLEPHHLWAAWSWEPGIVFPIGAAGALYARGVFVEWHRATHTRARIQYAAVSFAAGWIVLVVALVSPLHALGGVLFSAHMAQHELLMTVAAPLLVLARPLVPFTWALPMRARRAIGAAFTRGTLRKVWLVLSRPAVATAMHGVAIWGWHAPPLYNATLTNEWVHAAQHAFFLGTALLFWWSLIHGRTRRAGYGVAVIYVFFTAVHTTILGALLATAASPWYSAYAAAGTNLWGLTPLEDQQLGGLIMWIPATIAYLIAALALFAGWLRESELRVVKRENAIRAMIVLILCLIAPHRARAQGSATVPSSGKDSLQDSVKRRPTTLDPVIVSVTRGLATSPLDAPFAMTVLTPDLSRPGQRHVALDESLALVPGLVAANRTNPSQDPRISIRGFGARSTFGVRGVRILRDGMPLTLPDGQTPVDYLSLESVGRIEAIRGAAGALYGNASGGVIDLRTAPPPATTIAGEVRQLIGDYGLSRTTIKGGGISGPAYYQADASLTHSSGFRLYSRQRATSGFGRAGVMFRGTDYAVQMLGLDMPLAENPGALTLPQFRSNPRLADQPSVNKAARKVVRQLQVGVSADRRLPHDELFASAFIGGRTLYNPLTFAVVDVGRRTYGASGRFTHLWPMGEQADKLTAGFDLQSQNDSRRNFTNCNSNPSLVAPTLPCPVLGLEKGSITLDQRELVSGAGAYLNDELVVTSRLRLSGGLRADNVSFEVRDRLITASNPDDSGRRTLHAVTPYAGIVWRAGRIQSLYANVSSAFETPTATELGNHPDGSAGINNELKPQKSTTWETGFKGWLGNSVRFDVAGFFTGVNDELVPFEIPGGAGRRYFRNAGRTTRRGAELGFSVTEGPLLLSGAYSYSDFHFDRYATGNSIFDGRRIPGIPMNRGQASATLFRNAMFAVAETEVASSAFVDDANSARAPGYEVMHLRAGTEKLFGTPFLSLTAGVQNLFNRIYSPSVSVNAAAGKFFEPAPRRAFFVGVGLGRSN